MGERKIFLPGEDPDERKWLEQQRETRERQKHLDLLAQIAEITDPYYHALTAYVRDEEMRGRTTRDWAHNLHQQQAQFYKDDHGRIFQGRINFHRQRIASGDRVEVLDRVHMSIGYEQEPDSIKVGLTFVREQRGEFNPAIDGIDIEMHPYYGSFFQPMTNGDFHNLLRFGYPDSSRIIRRVRLSALTTNPVLNMKYSENDIGQKTTREIYDKNVHLVSTALSLLPMQEVI